MSHPSDILDFRADIYIVVCVWFECRNSSIPLSLEVWRRNYRHCNSTPSWLPPDLSCLMRPFHELLLSQSAAQDRDDTQVARNDDGCFRLRLRWQRGTNSYWARPIHSCIEKLRTSDSEYGIDWRPWWIWGKQHDNLTSEVRDTVENHRRNDVPTCKLLTTGWFCRKLWGLAPVSEIEENLPSNRSSG